MRVLFLDFDGVLHPGPDAPPHELAPFAWLPTLADLLQQYTEVAVVVHSNWRLGHDADELRALLGPLGDRFLGATSPGERYESILDWLRAHEAVDCCILDDDAREFPHPPPAELIIAPTHAGISDEETQGRLREWLDRRDGEAKVANRTSSMPR